MSVKYKTVVVMGIIILHLDYRNNFVKIDITLTPKSKKVICTFQVSDPTAQKQCKISIANGTNCQSAVKGSKNNTESSENTVSINLNDLIRDADEGKSFCYNLTARDGTEQVVVQDTIFIEIIEIHTENTGSNMAIISVVAAPIVILVVILIILLIILLCVSF